MIGRVVDYCKKSFKKEAAAYLFFFEVLQQPFALYIEKYISSELVTNAALKNIFY